jgi:hypothetical protein
MHPGVTVVLRQTYRHVANPDTKTLHGVQNTPIGDRTMNMGAEILRPVRTYHCLQIPDTPEISSLEISEYIMAYIRDLLVLML